MIKMKDFQFDLVAFASDDPWGKCLSSFLRSSYEKSGSIHTLTHYTQILRDFFSSPQKQPDAYDRDDIENFIHAPGRGSGREGQPPSPGLINDRLSCVHSFYNYAAQYTITNEQGVIQPVLRVPAPTLGIRQGKRVRAYRVLSANEVERFFAAIPRSDEQGLKYFAIFSLYLFTARRRAEILNLRWGDLEKAMITDNDGTRREAWTFSWFGKGHARERDRAELPVPAALALFKYLDFSGRLATMAPDDAIFTSDTTHFGRGGYNPKRPLSAQAVLAAAKKYARAASIDEKKATIHAFRHASARERFAAGSNIREIQQLLRHSSLAVTDWYLSTLLGTSDPGAKLLGARFGNL